MKKLFVLVSCFAVVLVLSKTSFAQMHPHHAPGHAHSQQQLSAAHIAAQAHAQTMQQQMLQQQMMQGHVPQALPFGVPPHRTLDGTPAFGVPYSFPRANPMRDQMREHRGEQRAVIREQRGQLLQRPVFSRFAPPPPQPHLLPPPGSAPGPMVMPEHPPMVAPPMTFGQVPHMHGMVTAVPAPPGPPTVVHRPTPFRNFRSLMFAPRPYLGYDPYAGFPPFPGYLPPQ